MISINYEPRLFQMNSSNIINNTASFDGFSINLDGHEPSSHEDQHQQNQLPMPCDHDHMPVFDPIMSHLLPSGSGCNNITTVSEPEMIIFNSSPSASASAITNKKQQEQMINHSGKKRKRINERETQPKEVVHVRAKRGQATDSHSLAERLRREKINDKLRCLQDLVPGCYKTMGMAVMLDVIINYVRSLQDQIDFLSMKLSAASLFYDFNSSEDEAREALQGTAGYEAGQVMEKILADGGIPELQSAAAWPL